MFGGDFERGQSLRMAPNHEVHGAWKTQQYQGISKLDDDGPAFKGPGILGMHFDCAAHRMDSTWLGTSYEVVVF